MPDILHDLDLMAKDSRRRDGPRLEWLARRVLGAAITWPFMPHFLIRDTKPADGSLSGGISGSLSLYLDLLRFGSALAVFIGHLFSNAIWSGGQGWSPSIQNDAVVCFFVLSGFVIGFVAEQKERLFSVYLRARLARLWSVAIPGLLITVLLDFIGHQADASAYFAPAKSGIATFKEVAVSALFLNEMRHWAVIPGSNLPYWSLSYEFAYYLLFGVAFYLRGWIRPVLLAGTALLIGPRILLLLPVWLLGWGVWRLQARLSPALGFILFAGSILAYLALSLSGAGPRLGLYLDQTLLADRWLGWSQLAGWKYLLGLLVAANILGFSSFADRVSFGSWAPLIRAAAGTTFALYLFHYPLLSFFGAVLPGPGPGLLHCLEIGALTLLCVLGLSQISERQKHRWQKALHRSWNFGFRRP